MKSSPLSGAIPTRRMIAPSLALVVIVCSSCSYAATSGTKPELPDVGDITGFTVDVAEHPDFVALYGTYQVTKDDWKSALSYLTPKNKYTDTLNDNIYPVVCIVSLTTKSAANITYSIRWMGKNPLLISQDGVTWYWGAPVGDNSDSAIGFLSFVKQHGTKQGEKR